MKMVILYSMRNIKQSRGGIIMVNMNEKIIQKKGYRLHIVNSEKFKTVQFTVKLRARLERETITKRALLPFVLQQGTERYPSANQFRRALDDLYGSVLSVDGSKKGDHHVITIRMEVANQTYLSTSKNILSEALEFLRAFIYQPKKIDGGFDPKIVEREKQTLNQKISALIDDKMSYANLRLIDEMCAGEAYSLHVHGYPEDLSNMDATNLYQYYQEALQNDQFDIYLSGDFEDVDMEALLGDHFDRNEPAVTDPVAAIHKEITEPKELIEEQALQQAKLHLGYRTNITFSDQDYPALQIFNAIFGGFPSSKLFINVREKNSLAYYAASRFESHKGLLFVFSGIDPKEYQNAKTIILAQMDAMQAGDFTDDQIEEAKKLVQNQYKETLDDPFGVIEVLYNQGLANTDRTIETFFSQLNQVNKEALVAVGKKLELDTTYFLTAQGGNIDG